jgi:hypothetical protein
VLQIDLRDLQVHGRLPIRLIPGGKKPFCVVFVARLQAFLFAADIVLNEKNSTVPFEKPISSFHKHPSQDARC